MTCIISYHLLLEWGNQVHLYHHRVCKMGCSAVPWQDKDHRVVQLAQEVKSWARKEVLVTASSISNMKTNVDNLDMFPVLLSLGTV